MSFHTHVEQSKRYYVELYPDEEKSGIAKNLLAPDNSAIIPDLEKMWKSIERAAQKTQALDDNLWVICFIESVFNAATLPPFFYMSEAERKETILKIERLTKDLSATLQQNNLDFHLIHNDGKIFNGFSFYEGYGHSNRARIDSKNVNKLKMSDLLSDLAAECTEEISYAHTSGKAGARVNETRFIRALGKANKESYRSPLNAVIAIAVLAIYGTIYSESDIANILNRNSKNEDPEQVIQDLATLSETDYNRVRGAKADLLGISIQTLDEYVADQKNALKE